ncbi:NF038120 family PEP-CTERM protein [Janthinobacterium fluminis]|uniref:NF038120 family PEP-CTERM protein n=1 Tax=Janthinobacterium fluminis TaxID=2987524 RepID=A0ABT5JY19_9BURK|nr:NF038120 family PEP-CTERM protein [Janthinobacterium fluminis]MDC8757628.1 NF038120 family PEP-CTERM protein [Janthinobacterium fluminis]
MKRTTPFFAPRAGLRAGLAAVALAAALPAAHAEVIDFEGHANTVLGHNETFRHGAFRLSGLSIADTAAPGDLVGMVIDANDAGLCANLACPPATSGNYFAGLNDGALLLAGGAGQQIRVAGFDASFIGAFAGATYPNLAGLLRVQGFYAAGGSFYEDFLLPGGAKGFSLQHFNASARFASQAFSSVAFFAFHCDVGGNCSGFNSGEGQFALDNVVASVPEPSAALLLLLGLAGIGAYARRRA